jgi:hypothetical protein
MLVFLTTFLAILPFDATFGCCPGARDPGSAPPNRRASKVRRKTPEINPWRPSVLDLSLPPLARLALGAGHRQSGNGRGLASCRLSLVLDLEGAARPTRTTSCFARSPRPIRKMCRENPLWGAPRIHGELLKLGFHIAESSVSKYMVRRNRADDPLPGSLRVSGVGP